ncbi:FkbM family methyltransferase [Litorivicinus lipolyticus]|uniref:FkbM family methyltransferase n=1 Tax=Litorivicinus lipolyticus TaxID=418701 RepID=UPI003B5BB444
MNSKLKLCISKFGNLIRFALNKVGLSINKAASVSDVVAAIEFLRPRKINGPLIQIGGKGDGVYRIPDDLVGISKCLSPGVGNTNEFEIDLYNRFDIPSDLIDYSVDRLPEPHEALSFQKKFLGMKSEGDFLGINDWVENVNSDQDAELIIQMDIEGSEYEVIMGMSYSVARKLRIIAIEFHNLELLCDRYGVVFLRSVFKKLSITHTPVYLKANNETPMYDFHGIKIPRNIEVTYIRNDRLQAETSFISYQAYLNDIEELNRSDKQRLVLSADWFGC